MPDVGIYIYIGILSAAYVYVLYIVMKKKKEFFY